MCVYLCETPPQEKDIARIVGANGHGKGCCNGPGVIATWCIGHLIEAAPPESYGERYKRWTIEALPIIPGTWRVEVKSSTAAQFQVVREILG